MAKTQKSFDTMGKVMRIFFILYTGVVDLSLACYTFGYFKYLPVSAIGIACLVLADLLACYMTADVYKRLKQI